MFEPRCQECGEHMEEMAQSGMYECGKCGFRAEYDVPAVPSYDPTAEIDAALDGDFDDGWGDEEDDEWDEDEFEWEDD